MLISTETVKAAATADAGKIRLGGGYRLPEARVDAEPKRGATADAGRIRLGGGYRLPVQQG